MDLKGYALVDSEQRAFSWHQTYEDADTRCRWENSMGRALRIVKDTETTWPDPDYDEAMCRALRDA